MQSPVLLILGGGANVGGSVARAFSSKGYKVASTSRTAGEKNEEGVDLHIQGDLSNASNIAYVFKNVQDALGPPTVVVYNAAATTSSDAADPLSLSIEDLNKDFQVNTASTLAAAKEAVTVFATLPDTASKTFIYTGNTLNSTPIAPLLSLGVGKAATAHLIHSASEVYSPKGFKFYYADERKADGTPAYFDISGAAHGEFYTELAEGNSDVPWLATFVKGKGYVNFTK